MEPRTKAKVLYFQTRCSPRNSSLLRGYETLSGHISSFHECARATKYKWTKLFVFSSVCWVAQRVRPVSRTFVSDVISLCLYAKRKTLEVFFDNSVVWISRDEVETRFLAEIIYSDNYCRNNFHSTRNVNLLKIFIRLVFCV